MLASSKQASWMPSWRASGYYLTLHFIELPSADHYYSDEGGVDLDLVDYGEA
jgi:hypothetical protein